MKKTRLITVTAMLSAMAVALQFIGSVAPLPKIGGFLEIEFSDIPAIIGSLSMGPLCGVLIEFIKNVIHLTVSTTGFVGEFANFVVNGIYVLVLGLIYNRKKTKKMAMVGFLAAIISYSFIGAYVNYYVMLPFFNYPEQYRLGLVLMTITPFNIVKGLALAIITLLVYKKLSPIIKGKTIY